MKMTTLIVIAAGLVMSSAIVHGGMVRLEMFPDSNGFFSASRCTVATSYFVGEALCRCCPCAWPHAASLA